jgi:hypothetical protein
MSLHVIDKEHPLYDKELRADGSLRESGLDTILNRYNHRRFIAVPDAHDAEEYERATCRAVPAIGKRLREASAQGKETNGMIMVFNYSPNEVFDSLYIGHFYHWSDRSRFSGRANMFANDNSFVELMADIAMSKDHHDGAVLVGQDGENKKVCVYLDIWLHAIKEAYGMPYSSNGDADLVGRAGIKHKAGRSRQLASILTSLVLADATVAVIRRNLDTLMFKNGFLYWPEDKRVHPKVDYHHYLGQYRSQV